MSTNRKSRAKSLALTTFYGGSAAGPCVQVSQSGTPFYISLKRYEAAALSTALALGGTIGRLTVTITETGVTVTENHSIGILRPAKSIVVPVEETPALALDLHRFALGFELEEA